MKKITVALLLSAAFAAPAFAADSGWYAGVDVGSASVGSAFAGPVYTSTRNTVGGVQLGYQYDKNLGAELFFTGAGKFTAAGGGNTLNAKSDVWGVSAVGTLPLSDTFSVYGRLGIASSNTSVSNSVAGTAATGKSRTAATYGLGLQYNVSPTVGVRFGVDSYSSAIANGSATGSTDNFNSTVTSLGVVFKF